MPFRLCWLVLFLYTGIVWPPGSLAHPHAELDYTLGLHLDGDTVELVELTFRSTDEVFLGFFLQDYDRNRDGHLDEAELSRAERNLFREWRRHGFFSLWEVEGERFRIYRAEAFALEFDRENGLRVRIELSLPKPVRSEFAVAIFDPDYFHNLEPGGVAVEVVGESSVDVHWEPRINREVTFYYGQLHPLEVAVRLVPAQGASIVVGPGGVQSGPELTLPVWDEEPSKGLNADEEPMHEPPIEAPPTGVVFTAGASGTGGWVGWLRWLNFQQQAIREWMADLRLQAQEESRMSPYVWMILASFLYGIIHAAGPGHGKAALAAYFAGGRTAGWRVCGVAAGTAFLHAGSGMALVWVVHGIFDEAVQGVLPEATRWTQTISAAMILLMGLVVAGLAWRRWRSPIATTLKKPRSWPVILALGLIPCPATVLVFLFCLSFNAAALGVVLVLALAAGMATCLIAVALSASFLGVGAAALAAHRTGTARGAAVVELASGVALALVGGGLLVASVAAVSAGWA